MVPSHPPITPSHVKGGVRIVGPTRLDEPKTSQLSIHCINAVVMAYTHSEARIQAHIRYLDAGSYPAASPLRPFLCGTQPHDWVPRSLKTSDVHLIFWSQSKCGMQTLHGVSHLPLLTSRGTAKISEICSPMPMLHGTPASIPAPTLIWSPKMSGSTSTLPRESQPRVWNQPHNCAGSFPHSCLQPGPGRCDGGERTLPGAVRL